MRVCKNCSAEYEAIPAYQTMCDPCWATRKSRKERDKETLGDQDLDSIAVHGLTGETFEDVLDPTRKKAFKALFLKQLAMSAKKGNVVALRILGEITGAISKDGAPDPYEGLDQEARKKRLVELLHKGIKNGQIDLKGDSQQPNV